LKRLTAAARKIFQLHFADASERLVAADFRPFRTAGLVPGGLAGPLFILTP
jgi:hypothetical protein